MFFDEVICLFGLFGNSDIHSHLHYCIPDGFEFLVLLQGNPLREGVCVSPQHIFTKIVPQRIEFLNPFLTGQSRNDFIHQLLRSRIQITILLLACCLRQLIRQLNQTFFHNRIVEAAAIDCRHNFRQPCCAFVPQYIPEVSLLFIDVQQIVAEDFFRQR